MNRMIKEDGWLIIKKAFSFFLSVFIVVSVASVSNCFALSNEDIVKQFFPQRLISESEEDFKKGGPEPSQFSDFVAADLDGTGTADYIVAAYTNGFSAAIRVLKKQGDTASLVAEPKLRLLIGIFPEIELINLDNSKVPEIIVSFSSARGNRAKWIFKWNGTTLNLMGPSAVDEYGNASTLLGDADFVDLDGDGVLEIIDPPYFDPLAWTDPERKVDTTSTAYKLKDNQYALWKSLVFYDIFIRNTSAPAVDKTNFEADRTDIPYLLTVVNGDSKGNNRVSSAVISLNGAVIAGPDMFNQKVFTFSLPVNLLASNTISVELRSKPGSKLTIYIEPQ